MTPEDADEAASRLAMKLVDVAWGEGRQLIASGVATASVEEVLTNASIITLAAFAATSDLDEEEQIITSLRSRLRDSKRINTEPRATQLDGRANCPF